MTSLELATQAKMWRYVFDTGAWIDYFKYYPILKHGRLWKYVPSQIRSRSVISPDLVGVELSAGWDDSSSRLDVYKSDLYVPVYSELQREVSLVLGECPRLLNPNSPNKNQADPFVVAYAKYSGATVVTSEKPSGQLTHPRVPDVCKHFKIPYMDLQRWMADQEWSDEDVE